MKEWMKAFIAFTSIIGGVCVIATERRDFLLDEWMCYSIGTLLIAGGVTYFWTQTKLYNK